LDPLFSFNIVEIRKICYPCWECNPDSLAFQPIAMPTEIKKLSVNSIQKYVWVLELSTYWDVGACGLSLLSRLYNIEWYDDG
jgi:hypothetical protein